MDENQHFRKGKDAPAAGPRRPTRRRRNPVQNNWHQALPSHSIQNQHQHHQHHQHHHHHQQNPLSNNYNPQRQTAQVFQHDQNTNFGITDTLLQHPRRIDSPSEALRTSLSARLSRGDILLAPRSDPREYGSFADGGMDRDSRSRRYDDGEVTRYGAGESYRPFNSNRSPRRARSPPRGRSPPLLDSDRYVPGRSPRRRSRSADRYRRDPSRDRRDTRDMGDSWRRRDRSRSLRRSPPRRSPPRRSPPRRSPPPRRFSPRRDDRDRLRSPRRGYETRRRSRSPLDRDRVRDRSPLRRSPPPIPRASTYRTRTRSPDRRDDRYGPLHNRRPSPPRDSAISSAMPSRDTSRRSSPHPPPPRRDDRSHPQSPIPSRPLSRSSHGVPVRERTPQGTPKESTAPPRSPPRGPAALRAPPTGPRDTRAYVSQSATAIGPPSRPASTVPAVASRPDISPSAPPAGPRGYVPSRGGSYSRGGRGGSSGPTWGNTIQSRNLPPAAGPISASAATIPNPIPTGPRAGSISQSVPTTPVNQAKPFNPPKGPAAESTRPSLAQQLLATLPPIIPGGKMDPHYLAMTTGVLPELQAHTQQLKEEEERLRAEKYVKEEKLRKSLALWDKFEREAKVLELRLELSENSVKKFAGDGVGGAAF
ncbi:uncharacterized protein F4812DRAFT_416315 [Daldinia caldariorum]|uniref:uncharacterized protein n=1 Tax=Daldinia caldariorum TaxID=326644 RepID=UPI0020076907|nr:uncharacterized protein F4812DRAFT_416315 [Daldinia caldariorum]KAI1471995.1 hypothetical protein F4812DRAFT_416315 [Daldinia caldariorum]